ncbi:O-antigen biosynthesis protein, partial [Candidatus Hakubella thermalkaliphila]
MCQTYRLHLKRYSTHFLILKALRPGRALDVGCNKGYLGSLGGASEWWSIDYDRGALLEASKSYKQVYLCDLNDAKSILNLRLPRDYFDYIIFADVLEHLVKPANVVRKFLASVKQDGRIIVSVPNVAHFSVGFSLLFGDFRYSESGILDKSHLHFWTRTS